MERFFDFFFSGLALVLLFPLLFPIVIILRYSGEGEIFFSQERIGRNGNSFKLLKFATMLKNSPNLGSGTITVHDDPRVLPVGKFLRKSKINELPQLLNILIGNMSIVGPRPLTQEAFNLYADNTQNIIKQVRPGLSGIGSIFFRDEELLMKGAARPILFYNEVIAPYKGSLEQWFVFNQSLKLYFKVIFITAWLVLFPKTKVVFKLLRQLPEPPEELKISFNYKE